MIKKAKTDNIDGKILIIDDEENNIRIMEFYLEPLGYDIITAANGKEGMEMLEGEQEAIACILLDRMMPVMDGIEFLKQTHITIDKLKIPVIMQTAAADPSQIQEGIDAGVYYYLTKPYEEDVLLSIVRSSIEDSKRVSNLSLELEQYKSAFQLVDHLEIRFRTMEDADNASVFLSSFYQDPDKAFIGISELLINAVEHGNLGIGYEEKTELNNQRLWHQEIEKRLMQEKYKNRIARANLERNEEGIILTITDQGNGFNWQQYMDVNVSRVSHNHGRGIAMANLMSFDNMQYNEKGNEVVCTMLNVSQQVTKSSDPA